MNKFCIQTNQTKELRLLVLMRILRMLWLELIQNQSKLFILLWIDTYGGKNDKSRWANCQDLWNIIPKFQNSKNITELARILNVSTKTIERDIKNPLISNQLQKISQKWSIKEDSKSAFVSNMLDKLSFSLGADFYQKACKYVHYGISNMHLADLALSVDIGSEKLESQHINYILLL